MNDEASTFKALSESVRLDILLQLQSGEKCVCTLQEAVNIPQSLLSHHLGILREACLVKTRREGKWVYYSLDTEIVKHLREFLAPFLHPKQSTSSPCS
jgi:ArsR family transcriptional regulator, arsenate/arsenite/antimonite-responsive transcriptional repressor